VVVEEELELDEPVDVPMLGQWCPEGQVIEPVPELVVEADEVVVLCACVGITARSPTVAKATIAATNRAVCLPMPMFISVFSSPPSHAAVARSK